MTTQTQITVSRYEHLIVYGAVHIVAVGAPLSQCFMFKYKWALLILVALVADPIHSV